MRQVITAYLILAFCIAIIVTILNAMGVTDAPLVRVWAFVWVPYLISFVISFLIGLSKRMDNGY